MPESSGSVQKKKRVKRDATEPEEKDLARIFTSWRMGWQPEPARVERLLIHIRYHASLRTRQDSDTGH